MLELLYQFLTVVLVDHAFVLTIHPTFANDFHSRLTSEAQDAGMELLVSAFRHVSERR